MKKFTFIVIPQDIEVVVLAETEKQGRKEVWEGLSEWDKDSTEYIECVDEESS